MSYYYRKPNKENYEDDMRMVIFFGIFENI